MGDLSGVETDMAILSVEDLHTYYGDSHILHGVSLEVGEGGVVAVLGRNGVGKTTLAHSIVGLVNPRQGKIVFRGRDITHLPAYRVARLGIRVVPQGRRVFGSLTVKQTLQIASLNQMTTAWSMDRVLALFPKLQLRIASRAGDLSGGEQQMLAIARAILGNPYFMVADEPTEGLSPMLVEEFARIITDLKTGGLSILLVEQNLPFALRLADYTYILSKGSVVHQSSTEEFSQNMEAAHKYLSI